MERQKEEEKKQKTWNRVEIRKQIGSQFLLKIIPRKEIISESQSLTAGKMNNIS
jgi:hypothetical protein